MAVEDKLLEIAEEARRVALGLIDAEVELALTSLRRPRNAFAHTADEIHLADPAMQQRLAEATATARRNPLWSPLEAVLSDHFRARGDARDHGQEPALRDYILLITILVAYLETAARTLQPLRPNRAVSFRQGIGPAPSAP